MTLDNEIWIATALLHRAHPSRDDFTLPEIRSKVIELNPRRAAQPGLNTYLSSHCVAGKPRQQNSIDARILVETGRPPARRRLYRDGDPFHPSRSAGKTHPARSALPVEFRSLLDWYENVYCFRPPAAKPQRERIARLRELIGSINGEDLDLMKRVIEEGCEQVDEDEWQTRARHERGNRRTG
ncbi:MAG TPA: hypothetical protein VFA60_09265 [Terriglobales bacterium]|nr:hypothetical protein [Terriglobales bacterium]